MKYICFVPPVHFVLRFYLSLDCVLHHDMCSVLSVGTGEQLEGEQDGISIVGLCVRIIACVDVGEAVLV